MQGISGTEDLPIQRQCALLAVSRSSVYYKRQDAVDAEDLVLMRLLDELHLKYPFMGSRRLRDELNKRGQGIFIN